MRPPLPEDWPAIEARLRRMLVRNPNNQMKLVDEDHALSMARLMPSVVNDGYFILYDVGSPWYTRKRVLIEELILRIGPTEAGARGAVRCLETLAREQGCLAIASGDTQVGAMVPHYLAEGFIPLGTQMFKELSNGEGP